MKNPFKQIVGDLRDSGREFVEVVEGITHESVDALEDMTREVVGGAESVVRD